jgi:hypothetical protein
LTSKRFRALLFVLLLVSGCDRAAVNEAASDKPFPSSSAQVEALRKDGVDWANAEIRAFYLRTIAAIAPANEGWKREGLPAEERARRAFQMRHDARLVARAMMKAGAEVEALRQRDREKYGTPDGPAFDWLVEHNKKKGLAGDALYEAIVESAQRTDGAVNEMFGLK